MNSRDKICPKTRKKLDKIHETALKILTSGRTIVNCERGAANETGPQLPSSLAGPSVARGPERERHGAQWSPR